MKVLCAFGSHAYGDPGRGEGYEHAHFIPALRALGHEVSLFDIWDRSAYRDFAALNLAFLRAVERIRPDLVFCVLMGYELWSETLDLLRAQAGCTVLNWGTDDSWKYDQFARFIAPHVDCYATTSRSAYERALAEGLQNVALTQWAAADSLLTEPLAAAQCRHPVTFVGSAYGNRRRWVKELGKRGIEVRCFGHGWPSGPVQAEAVRRIYRESIITLNFGDSGLHLRRLVPYRSRQIKARVFEVTGAGGFLLTEPAEDLEAHFRAGSEIETFATIGELADKIRTYLACTDRRDEIARAGQARTRCDHVYTARFAELLPKAVDASARRRAAATPTPWRFEEKGFQAIARRHRPRTGLGVLRAVLVGVTSMAVGHARGARAARRFAFELAWRARGRWTYSAAGWPGRMFYRES